MSINSSQHCSNIFLEKKKKKEKKKEKWEGNKKATWICAFRVPCLHSDMWQRKIPQAHTTV
jgi:hypothetical protein